MCRSIRKLHNLVPVATDEEIRAAALQFVRKVAGVQRPSRANAAAFDAAVEEITVATQRLMAMLQTSTPPRTREEEADRARGRALRRSG